MYLYVVYLQVKVENVGGEAQIITSVTFKNSVTNKVMTLRDTVTFPHTLSSGQFLELEVDAVAKFVAFSHHDFIIIIITPIFYVFFSHCSSPGFFSDILVLNFVGDWHVACLLDFFVDVDHKIRMPPDADRMPLKQGNLKYERRKNAITYE